MPHSTEHHSEPPTFLRTTLFTNELIGNVTVNGTVNLLSNLHATYFIGNGSQLTGLDQASLPDQAHLDVIGNLTGDRANVNTLSTIDVSAVGNVNVGGRVNVTGNVVGDYFVGNGSKLTGVTSALTGTARIDVVGNINGTSVNSPFVNAVSVSTGGANMSYGHIQLTGNVNANYLIGNGSQLTGITATLPATANIDIRGNVLGTTVAATIVNASTSAIGGVTMLGGQVTATGNVVGNYFVGNGSRLTGVASALTGVANVDIRGNVSSALSVTSNQVTTTGLTASTSTIGGVTMLGGQVTATGNVVGNYFVGNGSRLTGVASALTGVANVDIRGNVTASGNVSVGGQVNVTGNVVGNFFVGNGALLTGTKTTLPRQANIDIAGNVIGTFVNTVFFNASSVTATTLAGNGSQLTGITSALRGVAQVDIIGNVTATTGNIGNVIFSGGNVAASGQVNVTGNVVAGNFIGSFIGQTKAGPNFRATQTYAQGLAISGVTLYAYDTLDNDFNNTYYNNTGSAKTVNGQTIPPFAFCPNVRGYYMIGMSTRTQSAINNGREVAAIIYRNGVNYAHGTDLFLGVNTVGTILNSTVSAIVFLNGTTDYVQAYVYMSAGGSTTPANSWFNGMYMCS